MSRAVIVGSGVAGSLLAHGLLDRGVSEVIMLDAGNDVPMANRAWWLRFVASGETPYQKDYDTESDFESQGLDPWQIGGGRIFGRGGTTLHWGGWVPRFKPEDFRLYSNTGLGIDWPFGYEELESYYLKAEQWLGVSGDSKSQDPPRSGPYPIEAAPYPLSAEGFIKAFEELGYSYGHLPMARFGRRLNGSGTYVTTGTCDYCPVGGRFTGNQPLDRLEARQGFRLQLGAAVRRIRMASRAVAAGVTYTDLSTGQSVDLDADAVFLCAGALEISKLLLASRSSEWPEGIGNDHDLVGRFLAANGFFFANGIANNPQRMTQELGFPSLVSRHFDTEKEQATAKLFITMNYSKPYLNLAEEMAKGQSRADLDSALPLARRVFNCTATCRHLCSERIEWGSRMALRALDCLKRSSTPQLRVKMSELSRSGWGSRRVS